MYKQERIRAHSKRENKSYFEKVVPWWLKKGLDQKLIYVLLYNDTEDILKIFSTKNSFFSIFANSCAACRPSHNIF